MNDEFKHSLSRTSRYRSYLLCVLPLLLAFNGVDRIALGIMLQSIKESLRLTDVQLGLLNGIAFALFYSIMGVPIGFIADRGDRIKLISVTTALWGGMVSLCGAATSFISLILIRTGVAIGEAGCIPPSHSLMAEYFPRAERPRATAIYYTVSIVAGAFVGDFIAGWLNQLLGWRVTFALLGTPGIVLALLSWFTLEEPRRTTQARLRDGQPASVETPSHIPSVGACLLHLSRSSTFRHLLLAFAVLSFFGYGIVQWQPAFFIRSYGFQTGALGLWFTIIYGVGGAAGTLLGGHLASRFAGHNETLQLGLSAILYSTFGATTALIYLSSSYLVSFAIIALATVTGALVSGPLFATVQTIVPPRMRAVSISLLYLAGNLVGMGLGPLTVGILSDLLRPLFGHESLRYALLAMCPGYLWGGWHLWRASRSVSRDVAAMGPPTPRASCAALNS